MGEDFKHDLISKLQGVRVGRKEVVVAIALGQYPYRNVPYHVSMRLGTFTDVMAP